MTPSHPGDAPENPPVERYEEVPTYRTDGFVGAIILVGFFCIPPLLWWGCILVLTGDIYRKKVGKDGQLARWSKSNKAVALLLLAIQVVSIFVALASIPERR